MLSYLILSYPQAIPSMNKSTWLHCRPHDTLAPTNADANMITHFQGLILCYCIVDLTSCLRLNTICSIDTVFCIKVVYSLDKKNKLEI